MARPPVASLDDSYTSIKMMDFSDGLKTTASTMALGPNQTPDSMNVIPLPGRVIFRGGYTSITELIADSDQVLVFYDSNHAKHYAIWAGGSLYDCVTGVAVLVEAACYSAGQNVGAVCQDGVLYWSCGLPVNVPLRYWNPATGGIAAVVSAGGTGVADPPSSDFLFLYLDCIVALAPYWGEPLSANAYQPNVFCWSNVKDPTTWVGANAQAVGSLNNGRLEYGRPFGISAPGVYPTATIMIARNDEGIYAYSGALGELKEALLNCPFGIKDRFSAQYLPTDGNFGQIAFLATNGQVWATNGITANSISDDILPSMQAAFYTALNTGESRFYSGYNQQWQYYYIDMAGQQFGYRWATKAWFPMSGWPTGISFTSFDSNGLPAYYVASVGTVASNPFVLGQSVLGAAATVLSGPGLFQIAQIGVMDNGGMPSVYWKTPILHGGDMEMFKEWHWGAIATYDTGATYDMDAVSIRQGAGSQMVASTVSLVAPADTATAAPFTLGTSVLAGTDGLGNSSLLNIGGLPVVMQERFRVPVEQDEWTEEDDQETLKGCGIQITISWSGGAPVFDLLGIEVLYVARGYLRGAGSLYNPEDLTDQPFDPWSDY